MLFSFFSPKNNNPNPRLNYFILRYSRWNPHKPETLCGFVVSLYSISMRNEITPAFKL